MERDFCILNRLIRHSSNDSCGGYMGLRSIRRVSHLRGIRERLFSIRDRQSHQSLRLDLQRTFVILSYRKVKP